MIIRRFFSFLLGLTIDAKTGFSTYSLNTNSQLTLFRIKKVSRGWSFWSIIKTSFLSYSCFFLLLAEVEGVGDSSIEESREDEEGRFFFNFSA